MQSDIKINDMIRSIRIAAVIGAIFIPRVYADELIYTPINPSFGGSPLNGNWMLSNAQAQDTFEDPASESADVSGESELDNFNSTLERVALSRIASQLVSQFLDGEASSLETDNLILDITEDPTTGHTTIKTTDKGTGEVTIIDLGFKNLE